MIKTIDRPIGNKKTKIAIQDASIIKLALELLKDAQISDVSTSLRKLQLKKNEALFYKNKANLWKKIGGERKCGRRIIHISLIII